MENQCLRSREGGVNTGSPGDHLEDPLCIVAPALYRDPPRTSSRQDSRALNPDNADSIVDDNKHIIAGFGFQLFDHGQSS